MRAWILKYNTICDYIIITEYGDSLFLYKNELYKTKNRLNLNILNIKNNKIASNGNYELIDSWEFNGKSIDYLCKQFNAKAAMLDMNVECVIDRYIGGCAMVIKGNTYIPEKIPDWVNIIVSEGIRYKVLNQKVKLGKTTYIIGINVFNSSNLEKIEFNSRLAIVGSASFNNCLNLNELRFPKHILHIDPSTVHYGTHLKTLSLYKPTFQIHELNILLDIVLTIDHDIIEFRTPNLEELDFEFYTKIRYKHIIFNDKLKNIPIETLLMCINAKNEVTVEFKSFPNEE